MLGDWKTLYLHTQEVTISYFATDVFSLSILGFRSYRNKFPSFVLFFKGTVWSMIIWMGSTFLFGCLHYIIILQRLPKFLFLEHCFGMASKSTTPMGLSTVWLSLGPRRIKPSFHLLHFAHLTGPRPAL